MNLDSVKRNVQLNRLHLFLDKWKLYHLSTNRGVFSLDSRCIDSAPEKVNWVDYLPKNLVNMDQISGYDPEIVFRGYSRYGVSKYVVVSDLAKYISWPWNMYGLSENTNITFDTVLSFPQLQWQYSSLSLNKSITFKNILENQHCPWNWVHLSCYRDDITLQIIKQAHNQGAPWHLYSLSLNESIPIEEILKDKEFWPFWEWEGICMRKDLKFHHVMQYQDAPWDWDAISGNDAVYMFRNIERNQSLPWNWFVVSTHKRIPFYFIRDNPTFDWNWYDISQNVENAELVISNLSLPWCFRGLSKNLNFQEQDLVELLTEPRIKSTKFIWSYISSNPNVSMNLVLKFPYYPWNWKHLSANHGIPVSQLVTHPQYFTKLHWNLVSSRAPLNVVLQNPYLPWAWKQVSSNLALTLKVINAYPNMPWNWTSFSLSPQLRFHDIVTNTDKPWNWKNLSKNPSLFWVDICDNDAVKYLQTVHAARVIQRQWRLCSNCPLYFACKKRLFAMCEEDSDVDRFLCFKKSRKY